MATTQELFDALQAFKQYVQANLPFKLTVFSGTSDPVATGVVGIIPSVYFQLDSNGEVLNVFYKKAAGNTDWEEFGSGGGGGGVWGSITGDISDQTDLFGILNNLSESIQYLEDDVSDIDLAITEILALLAGKQDTTVFKLFSEIEENNSYTVQNNDAIFLEGNHGVAKELIVPETTENFSFKVYVSGTSSVFLQYPFTMNFSNPIHGTSETEVLIDDAGFILDVSYYAQLGAWVVTKVGDIK